MYSIFLPFAAIVIDLCVAYIYFKHDWWVGGITTSLIALVPLFIIAFFLYCGWSRLKQATVFFGFLHSGTQLLFQVTLLFKHWSEFSDVIIEFGTMKSPQYSIVMVSCIFSSLVVAKSARECHFLCQAPQKNHVAASHFRATPFFLLHTSFRSISLGLIAAFFPLYPWSWYAIMILFLAVNFVVAFKMFGLSLPNSFLTSFTSVLTPSIYPSDAPVREIAFIAKFHIANSIITTVFIALCALVQFFTSAELDQEWNSLEMREWFEESESLGTGIGNSSSSSSRTSVGCNSSSNSTSSPSDGCKLPQLPGLPLLLQAGILPPIIVVGVVYLVIVTLTMGLIRPSFLELPVSRSPAAAIEAGAGIELELEEKPEVSKLLQ